MVDGESTMSVKMIAGRTGSGKSTYVFDKVSKAATENPEQSYFVIVPDQFTMQTQADLVRRSERGGIMNIEVLSFSRLAHRVFEETGGSGRPVLDDTGKNLILRRCAVEVSADIPYLAGKIDKPGYIHEIKSAISEFMQYGIGDRELSLLIDYASSGNKLTLAKKLGDLSVIYGRFREYIKDRYFTAEESMDILARDVYRSRLLKDSIVIFDGFTGFTPVQNKVLGAIMDVAKDVIFTLTADPDILMTDSVNESDLFAFTKKSYGSVVKIASDHGLETELIAMRTGHRYFDNPELSFLEEHFYRYDGAKYDNTCNSITLNYMPDIRTDVRGLVLTIKGLTSGEGVYYRDIAVITGNLDAYASQIEDVFAEYDIPFYMDRNRAIEQNPFIEYIRAALGIIVWDYDYESVFRLLKTGFTDIEDGSIDRLDDYVTETGIKGRRAYSVPFVKKTGSMRSSGDLTELDGLNRTRQELNELMSPFAQAGIERTSKRTASEYVRALYGFILKSECNLKLKRYEEMFTECGEYASAREYAQVYRYVCELLEQIDALTGSETMDPAEFALLLEAGLNEIKVGTIPQSVDRVIIGDMERTRLKPVRFLFFLGLNDGWVPRNTGKGGIISDGDREFLSGQDIELSPSPRSQAYIDRFYLYTVLCKPSEMLYLSYVSLDNALNAVKPSYMVSHIRSLFPQLTEQTAPKAEIGRIGTPHEVRSLYAGYIREYAAGNLDMDGEVMLKRLHGALVNDDVTFADRMLANAFSRYEHKKLDERIAALLYGTKIIASVSRIETYAACAYSYFLRYGLELKEREKYGVEAADMGTIYHGVLEVFTDLLKEKGLNWFTFDDVSAEELVNEAVERESIKYTDAILFESEQGKYTILRMKAVMLRTVKTLAHQLRAGSFAPYKYEYSFKREMKGVNSDVTLKGKIDRLDVARTDDAMYIKIVDYKSGNKDFSLLNLYNGVQLQMVIYMNRAVEDMKAENPGKEVIPAALLYYHIDDPIVEAGGTVSDEKISSEILKNLRGKGIIDDDTDVVHLLDNSDTQDSEVIRVSRKSNGDYTSSSQVMSRQDMSLISEYADHKLLELAGRIKTGDIDIDPKLIGTSGPTGSDSCRYCDYCGVCGFDEHMPGYDKTRISKEDEGVILTKMKEELEGKDR